MVGSIDRFVKKIHQLMQKRICPKDFLGVLSVKKYGTFPKGPFHTFSLPPPITSLRAYSFLLHRAYLNSLFF
jgi:hypothetical protein